MKDEEIDSWTQWLKVMEDKIMENVKQQYSHVVINEWLYPSNVGRMKDADRHAIVTGPCGDTMELYMKIRDKKISKASFMTDGCGATIACGSMITKILTNLPINKAEKITDEYLLKKLEGLPIEHMHCATLTIKTLKKALDNFNREKL